MSTAALGSDHMGPFYPLGIVYDSTAKTVALGGARDQCDACLGTFKTIVLPRANGYVTSPASCRMRH